MGGAAASRDLHRQHGVINPDEEAWRRRVGGLELSEWTLTGRGGVGKFVGMEFCLGATTLTRPSASLVRKWRAAVAGAREGRDAATARELCGLSVALCERGMWPLALIAALLRPRPGPLGPDEEAEVAAVEQRLEGGGWTRSHFPEEWVRAATDASGSGWGVVMWDGGATRTWAGVFRHPETHINLKELSAVERAVELAPANREVRVDVDSEVVAHWVNGGNAQCRWAREMLLRMDAKLGAKGCVLRAQWVEGTANPADCLSRGRAFVGWDPPAWAPPRPRRVLGGAVAARALGS